MASRKFRFVSPGVFLKEIDNSQLPGIPDAVGPVIIGRTRKGPALTPYKVKSLEEFERVFGRTMPGNEGEDPWREGTDLLAESYAPYAAKAYLSADIDSPVTIVRLAGIAGDAAKATDAASPGWKSDRAYGLFLFNSSSDSNPADARDVSGTLAAIFYGTSDFSPKLYAASRNQVMDHPDDDQNSNSGAHEGILIKEDSNKKFTLRLDGGSGRTRDVSFSFDKIREGFNTNPTKTNSNITGRVGESTQKDLSDLYWLGETFEESYKEILANKGSGDALAAMVLKLDSQMSDFKSGDHSLQAAKTGWFIAQDTTSAATGIVHDNAEKLFRAVARQDGFKASRELMVSIERINIPRENATDTFGSFSLIVNQISGTRLVEVERFDNLNLNPISDNYVAKKIGTQYYKWDSVEKRNKVYGTYPNISEYIRIELHPRLVGAPPADPSLVPFGFLGPIVPKVKEISGSDFASGGTGSFASTDWVDSSAKARVGALSTNASSKLVIQWPKMPLINSGSLSDGFMMGASPFKQTWTAGSKHTAQTILNPGYVDYTRRLPEFSGLTADQDSGEVGGSTAEHSFIFSLEDVVLHANPQLGGGLPSVSTVGDVVLAEYVSGSRNGAASAAKAVLTAPNPSNAHGLSAGENIVLTSADSATDNTATTLKAYKLTDALLSSADTTASTVTPITNGAQIGANAVLSGTKGTLANVLTIDGGADGHECQITVPAAAGGAGAPVKIKFVDALSDTVAVDTIELKVGTLSQMNLLKAVDGNSVSGEIKFGSGIAANGIAGLVGSNQGQNANHVGLSLVQPGDFEVIVANNAGNIAAVTGADIFSLTATGVHATTGVAVLINGDHDTQGEVLANLKAAILSSTGHNGKIQVVDDSSDGDITLIQNVKGANGNTSITSTFSVDFRPSTNAFSGGGEVKSYAREVADGNASSLRVLASIVDGFRAPLVGGFEGVDITEADPFNNRVLAANGASADSNYAFASVDRAIQLISNAEMVEHNLAVMPGITNSSLTTDLVRACESRGDSLAIIDLPDVYVPPSQAKCDSFESRIPTAGNPENSAKNLTDRQLNSSYGAAYYPWVKIKDEDYNRDVWVPPSVVALGVMAYTEERDEVWFAPAGFNRGGLNEGNAGLPVLQVSDQLMSKDRDTLYAANINPIASFVSEGIVIFGQKTLQTTQSALDRINVRRLLIFVKKKVSQVSKDLLFEQNVRATWNKFLAQVNPFLESVKTRFGLSDYKVVLDSTTTTPDLVDRNILYAKVLLKPARAIEFIAVDFVITNTGASFED